MWFEIVTFIAVTYIVRFVLSRRRLYKLASRFPGPKTFPIVGNLHYFFMKDAVQIFKTFKSLNKEFGGVFRLWNGHRLEIVVSDPSAIQTIWEKNMVFERRPAVKNYFSSLMGDGLLTTSDLDKWKIHKRIISKNLHVRILEDYVDSFVHHSCVLTDRLAKIADNTPIELRKYILDTAFDTVFQTATGIDMKGQYREEYLVNLDLYHNINEKRIKNVLLYNKKVFNLTKLGEQQRNAASYIRNICSNIIDQKQNDFMKSAKSGEDCNENKLSTLELLMRSSTMDKEDLIDEIQTILIASRETNTIATCFTLVCLGEHQEVQNAVYEEQKNIFADDIHRLVTKEDLRKMVYLEQVIQETLRLYPPATFLRVNLREEITADNGYTFPENSQLTVFLYGMHRNPEFFPEPERFFPERFSPENMTSRHPYAYMPFGKGRSMCPGNNYAMLQIKTLISTLLRRLQITETVGGMKNIDNTIRDQGNLAPKDGFNVRLLPRKNYELKTTSKDIGIC